MWRRKLKYMSFFSCSFLFFAELRAILLGPSDLYVKTGSDINLVCKISKGPHDLGTVFWYKGNGFIKRPHQRVHHFFFSSFFFILPSILSLLSFHRLFSYLVRFRFISFVYYTFSHLYTIINQLMDSTEQRCH